MQEIHDLYDHDALDDVLEHFFDKYITDNSILTVTELDGFFAGLACAPNLILPSQWIPAVWGGEALMPDWEDRDEISEFHQALMQSYQQVVEEFLQDEFSPRIYGEAGRLVMMDEWCDGFLRGVHLYGPLQPEDQAVLQQHLDVITLFASDARLQELLSLAPDQVQARAARIEPSVLALRKHFFQRQLIEARTPMMNAAPSAGRNDPCPCGSGKKFKKCCLH